MDIFEFAEKLNGREYLREIASAEEKEAKDLGFVVVYGVSDDLCELRGAIDCEADCYDGGIIFLDKNGIFENCDSDCKYALATKRTCKEIRAVWCGEDGYSWTYETDISHATFDIFEDGEKYCRGIVFDIKSLETIEDPQEEIDELNGTIEAQQQEIKRLNTHLKKQGIY